MNRSLSEKIMPQTIEEHTQSLRNFNEQINRQWQEQYLRVQRRLGEEMHDYNLRQALDEKNIDKIEKNIAQDYDQTIYFIVKNGNFYFQ